MKSASSNLLINCPFAEKLSEESRAVFATFPADWNALYVRAIGDAMNGKTLLLRRIRSVTAIDYSLPEGVTLAEENWETPAGALRVRFYLPAKKAAEPAPAVLYVHGGGWCMGGIENSSLLCGKMAAHSGMIIVVPSYRLAPEAPFPAALDDIGAAAKILRARAADWGVDPEKIFWAGDSAGGQLCLTAALRMLDECSEVQPAGIALFYPVTSLLLGQAPFTGSQAEFDKSSMLSNELLACMAQTYVADTSPEARAQRYISPAETALAGLPKTLILAAECDILSDDARALAEKLSEAGVPVTYKLMRGVPHAFALVPGFNEAQEALLESVADFCR